MRAHALLGRRFAGDPAWKQASMREYDVLYTLVKAARPLRQSELLDQVMLSQPALSRLLAKMVDKGLLVESANPTDARSSLFEPSPQGLDLQRRLGKAHAAQIADALYSVLSPEQLQDLKTMMDLLACGPGQAGITSAR